MALQGSPAHRIQPAPWPSRPYLHFRSRCHGVRQVQEYHGQARRRHSHILPGSRPFPQKQGRNQCRHDQGSAGGSWKNNDPRQLMQGFDQEQRVKHVQSSENTSPAPVGWR